MTTLTPTYREELTGLFTDPEEAGEYLAACFCESNDAFLVGLRDIVAVRGGMTQLSEATGLAREALYRALSPGGNPRLSSLRLILAALGLQLNFIGLSDRNQGQPSRQIR